MEKLRKLFGGLRVSWLFTLIFAVATAVLTAVLNVIPVFAGTSLSDPAVYLDVWIVYAVFLAVNCEKWYEASAKVFVFFLVSQPLIYLLEVPFSSMGWGLFGYYPRWLLVTFLTLPGAAVAFFAKKRNLLAALILCVPAGYYGYMCATFAHTARWNFPHHLLSAVFCAAATVFFLAVLLDRLTHRLTVLAVFLAALLAVTVILNVSTARAREKSAPLPSGEDGWTVTADASGIVSVSVEEEIDGSSRLRVRSEKDGHVTLFAVSSSGVVAEFDVTVSTGHLWLSNID